MPKSFSDGRTDVCVCLSLPKAGRTFEDSRPQPARPSIHPSPPPPSSSSSLCFPKGKNDLCMGILIKSAQNQREGYTVLATFNENPKVIIVFDCPKADGRREEGGAREEEEGEEGGVVVCGCVCVCFAWGFCTKVASRPVLHKNSL